MDISDIGTKSTESTIVLHLHNVKVALLTPAWLHDTLGLRVDELWSALQWPTNEHVLEQVYATQRDHWSGTIVRILADGEVEQLEMPAAASVEQQLDLLLEGQHAFGESFAAWSLPRVDFEVPFSGTLLGQMCGLVRGESSSCVTVASEAFVFPHDAVAELIARVEALRERVAAREAEWQRVATSLAAHRKVSNLLRLVARGWHTANSEVAPARAAKVDALRIALAEAHEEVVNRLVADESDVADAVLEMLSDGDLVEAAEKLAFDPMAVDADDAEELATAIRHGCEALARSVGADRLLRDHAWPAVGEACKTPPYAFDRIVADLENAELREQLATGWVATHDEVQRRLGAPEGDSILKKLAKAGKYYRVAPSIITSAMSEGVLMTLWDSLDGKASWRGSRLSALLLRFVISTGVPDPNNARLMFAGRLDFGKVLAEIDRFPKMDDIDALTKRADALKQLKLKEQFLRSRGAIGLGLVASTAILWAAAVDDEQWAIQRACAIAAGIAGVLESASHIAIAIKAYQGQVGVFELTKPVNDVFGRAYVIFGALASAFAFAKDRKAADALSFTGGALRTSGWVLTSIAGTTEGALAEALGASGRLGIRIVAGWLGMIGSIVGGIALAWAILPKVEIPIQGVEKVLYPYFDLFLAPDGAFAAHEKRLRVLLTAARPALAVQFPAIRVPTLPGGYDVAGTPGVWGPDEVPTFHAAHMLGFTAGEIATMFGAPEDDVAALGIETDFRGRRKPPRFG